MGALPESEVKKFLDKHLEEGLAASPAEALMETASEALAAGQLDDALECYAAALAQEPDNVAAQAGLAQCHLARGDSAAAAAILDAAPPHDNDPALASARAAVALAQKIAEKNSDDGFSDEGALTAALAADENNHQARFDWRWRIMRPGNAKRHWTHYWKSLRVSAIGKKKRRASNCSNFSTLMARKMNW